MSHGELRDTIPVRLLTEWSIGAVLSGYNEIEFEVSRRRRGNNAPAWIATVTVLGDGSLLVVPHGDSTAANVRARRELLSALEDRYTINPVSPL